MSSIKLDDNHDLTVENNDLSLIVSGDEVKQILLQKFKMFYKEWFLDTSKGIPYFEEVLVKGPNPFRIDAIFKDVIIKTNGVIELLEYELDFIPNDRRLKLYFLAKSTSGTITFNEVLP